MCTAETQRLNACLLTAARSRVKRGGIVGEHTMGPDAHLHGRIGFEGIPVLFVVAIPVSHSVSILALDDRPLL